VFDMVDICDRDAIFVVLHRKSVVFNMVDICIGTQFFVVLHRKSVVSDIVDANFGHVCIAKCSVLI